jgi:hypothetical protein
MSSLPGDGRRAQPDAVQVTPRAANGQRCPVYAADFYEVAAYYVSSNPALLDRLEAALTHVPGVYRTTRVAAVGDHSEVQDRSWPVGSTRRDKMLRVQVLALMRDPEHTP